MPEARSWPHRGSRLSALGSRLSALMMLSPDRIAFVKPFFEVFITFSPIRSARILLGPALAGLDPPGDGLKPRSGSASLARTSWFTWSAWVKW